MGDTLDDLKVHYERAGTRVRPDDLGEEPLTVVTSGLADRDHPELELVGVDPELAGAACTLVLEWADSMIGRKRIPAGEFWGMRRPDRSVTGGMVVQAGKRLRLVDLGAGEDEPARAAICACVVDEALELDERDDRDGAIALLEKAIAWYPGDEYSNPAELAMLNTNLHNNRAHLALAVFGVDADAHYLRAIQGSNAALCAELAPAGEATLDDLERFTHSLVAQLHALAIDEPVELPAPGPGVRFLLSPMLRVENDKVTQSLAIGPVGYTDYFFTGEIAERLASREVAMVIAEIYAKWWADASEALGRARETAWDIYEMKPGAETAKRAIELENIPLNVVPLLSRIAGAVGRDLAAGMTIDELSARWGLDGGTPEQLEIADAKLEALREREGRQILEAYGFT